MKHLISWVSGYYKHEGCSKPPFDICIDGEIPRNDGTGKTNLHISAYFNNSDIEEIKEIIVEYFPDYHIVKSCKRKIRIPKVLLQVINMLLLLLWIIISILGGIYKGVLEGCKKMWAIFLTGLNKLIINK